MCQLWSESCYYIPWLFSSTTASQQPSKPNTVHGGFVKKLNSTKCHHNISVSELNKDGNSDHDLKHVNQISISNSHPVCIELCNIRSVSNKLNLVSTYLRSHQNLDILFLTETWLKPKHNDSMFCPDGYEVIRCDRQRSRGVGRRSRCHLQKQSSNC